MDAFVSALYHINVQEEKLFEYHNGQIHIMTKRGSGKDYLALTEMLAKTIESNLWGPLLKEKALKFINDENNSQAIKKNIKLFKEPWLNSPITDSDATIELAESFLKQILKSLDSPRTIKVDSTNKGKATLRFRDFNIQFPLKKLTDVVASDQPKYSDESQASAFIAAFEWLAFDDETHRSTGLNKSSFKSESIKRKRSRIVQGKISKLIDSKIEAIGQAFLSNHEFLSEQFRQQFRADAFKSKNAIGKYYCILLGAVICTIVYERCLVLVGRNSTEEEISAMDSFFRGALQKVIKKGGNPTYWVERTGICLALMNEPFVRKNIGSPSELESPERSAGQSWINGLKVRSQDIQNPTIVSKSSIRLLDKEYRILVTVLDVLYLPLSNSQKNAELSLPHDIDLHEVSNICIEKYGWVLHRLAIIFYCRWFEYQFPCLQLERTTKNQIAKNDKPLLLWYLGGLRSLWESNQYKNSKEKYGKSKLNAFFEVAEYADVTEDIEKFKTDSSMPGSLNFWGEYFWRKIERQEVFKAICELIQDDYSEELYRVSSLENLAFFAPLQPVFVPKDHESNSRLGRQEKTTQQELEEFLHFASEESGVGAWAKRLVGELSDVFGFVENLAQLFFDNPRIKATTRKGSSAEQRTRDARAPKLKSGLLESTFFNDRENTNLPPNIEISKGLNQSFYVLFDGNIIERFPDEWIHKTRKKDFPLLTVIKNLSFSSLTNCAGGDPIDPNEAVISDRLRYTMARIKRYLFICRITFRHLAGNLSNCAMIEELEHQMFYHVFAQTIEERLLLLDPSQRKFKQKAEQTEQLQTNEGEAAEELNEYDLSEFIEAYLQSSKINEMLSNWLLERDPRLSTKTEDIFEYIRKAYIWEVLA